MPDIKTRDSLKTIKTFQRAGAKVKDSSAEAKRRIEETQDHGEASESEYAGKDQFLLVFWGMNTIVRST